MIGEEKIKGASVSRTSCVSACSYEFAILYFHVFPCISKLWTGGSRRQQRLGDCAMNLNGSYLLSN